MTMPSAIFSKAKLGGLILKNRVIKAGCFEGMSQEGKVQPQLIEHHEQMAKGGVAMTTVAYCSVSQEGRAFDHELWMREEILPELRHLTSSVHSQNALASIQLGHCGYFSNPGVTGKRPVGASHKFNLFRLSWCKALTLSEIQAMTNTFSNAAILAQKAGFDAIEIHAGHGYLLSQFLSPYTNKRKDEYGGNLSDRMRFPREVIQGIRKGLGPDFPILVKMNLEDGMRSGLTIEEAVKVARMFEGAGASALIPSSGFTSKTPFLMLRGRIPIAEMLSNQKKLAVKAGLYLFGKYMVKEFPYSPLFHLEEALKIKDSVQIPVIYIGGIKTRDEMVKALNAGFDFVQIGRALIHEPLILNQIKNGEDPEALCDHCNRCVAAMDGGGVYCVSREKGYMKSE